MGVTLTTRTSIAVTIYDWVNTPGSSDTVSGSVSFTDAALTMGVITTGDILDWTFDVDAGDDGDLEARVSALGGVVGLIAGSAGRIVDNTPEIITSPHVYDRAEISVYRMGLLIQPLHNFLTDTGSWRWEAITVQNNIVNHPKDAEGYGNWVKREANPPTVPEPTTFLLLGIGIAGLAGVHVKRMRKKKAVDNS